jgi:hypothetical protein
MVKFLWSARFSQAYLNKIALRLNQRHGRRQLLWFAWLAQQMGFERRPAENRGSRWRS